MSYYQSHDHVVYKELNRISKKCPCPNLDHLDSIFLLFKNNLPPTYQMSEMISVLFNFIEKVLSQEDLEIADDHYKFCFFLRKKYKLNDFYLLKHILHLDCLPAGRRILEKNDLNLSKNHHALREGLYKESINNLHKMRKNMSDDDYEKQVEIIRRYEKNNVDYKKMSEEYPSMGVARYTQLNGVELSKRVLSLLIESIYNEFITAQGSLTRFDKSFENFSNILSNTNIFKKSIAPAKDFQEQMFKFFDKKYTLPNYEIDIADQKTYDPLDLIFYNKNEFSKMFYNSANYRHVHLKTQIEKDINVKISGKPYVHPEIHEENQQLELESLNTYKKIKI